VSLYIYYYISVKRGMCWEIGFSLLFFGDDTPFPFSTEKYINKHTHTYLNEYVNYLFYRGEKHGFLQSKKAINS